MEPDKPPAKLHVSVAYSPRAGVVDEVAVSLDAGATVADAVRESGLALRYPALTLDSVSLGIWGAFCRAEDVLRDRDRVEVYRPLLVDPKEARRLRYRGQAGTRAKAKIRRA
jgi:putative ubiquitin-RnfH superfamily antitoxin RatB of RatAB toxin-antitoxin module